MFKYAIQAEGSYAQYIALQYNSYLQQCAHRTHTKPLPFARWKAKRPTNG